MGLNPRNDLKPRHIVGVFYLYFELPFLFRIFNAMKKYAFILAIGVALTLTACGSGSTATETTDSTAAQVDSMALTATDSTTAEIGKDSVTTVK